MKFNPKSKQKILVFIVAYNAEKTIIDVLNRIPLEMLSYNMEVLIIDDASPDRTFEICKKYYKEKKCKFPLTVLKNAANQGYGGNQKLGYHYAIINNFDFVILLHGDGQYAPEKLPDIMKAYNSDDISAVFGSRMINKGSALKGGMPFYKWIGNQILTAFQNFILGSKLSEFHSGYRSYSVDALKKIPFEKNSNGFHFDTEIIIQLFINNLKIIEIPIPTHYGDEVCYVNGMHYALNITKESLIAKLCKLNIFYNPKYEYQPNESIYQDKTAFYSPHSVALRLIKGNDTVLDLGCGGGYLAKSISEKKNVPVTGIDLKIYSGIKQTKNLKFIEHDINDYNYPVNISKFNKILLMDVIEHLKNPEEFIYELRKQNGNMGAELLISTGNIAFIILRIQLLLGQFNYGKKGILDMTHTRLFTFKSFKRLLIQAGYKVVKTKGVPVPFALVFGNNWFSKLLTGINLFFIFISKTLFSYQIFIQAKFVPTVENIFKQTLVNK